MSSRIYTYVRNHHLGLVAIFIAMSGTAYATHPGGANTIDSGDIIDAEVKTADVEAQAITGTRLAPSSVNSAKVVDGSLTGIDIANSSVSGGDITNQSLTDSDAFPNGFSGFAVWERSLTPLDGHDAFEDECNPESLGFTVCEDVVFELGRSMEVSATVVYGFGTEGDDPPRGECRTLLDGVFKDTGVSNISEDDSDLQMGGTPFVDVMALDAGTHNYALACNESDPDNRNIEIRDIGISVVELGFD